MIFWMVVALLAGGLGVALARPLLRGSGEAGSVRAAYDMQVYRDQLDEIERDRARGVVTDDQAAAARLEVERRLLVAGEDSKRDLAKGGGGAPLLAAGVAAVVPVAAIAVYATLGWPGVPGYPLAQRMDRPQAGPQLAQAAQGGQPNAADPHPAGGGSTESMAQLTDRLAKRLEANPGDAEGWSLLARSYQQLNRHREAISALERAVALTDRAPQMVATLGEARIMAADGSVIPQARAEFEEVLKAEPKDPRSRFYIAIAETQAGNMMRGLDQLVGIARDATPDAPYLPMLRERIGALANDLKQDPAKLLAALPKPVEPGQAPAAPAPQAQAQAPAPPRQERGPSAADVQAAQQLSPQDRAQMIKGMIDGLAARLESDPSDVEGWLRLIRAHKVQGDDARATDAVAKAVAANPEARPRIVQTAQQLGVAIPTAQAAPTPAPIAPPAAPRGPSAADVQAAQQMSPQDRQQMIRGMVDGLAQRMEQNPNDVEGWLRLIRAYKVLGDDAKAVEAAGKASAANPGAMAQIVALSNQLGLGTAAPTQTAATPRPLDAEAIRSGAPAGDAAPFRTRLATNPNDREALWQVGLAEVAAGNKFEAVELWGRLLGQFDPASAEYTALRERLDALKRGG